MSQDGNKWDEAASDLGDLISAIDSEMRAASVRAHNRTVQLLSQMEAAQIGGVEVHPASLIPREVLGSRRVALEFELTMRDNGVSLSRAHRFGVGSGARVKMEWEADEAPEATALVRTSAEADLNKRLKAVDWTPLQPATPIPDQEGKPDE